MKEPTMKTRKNTKARSWMSTANLLKNIAKMATRYQGNQNRAELEQLKAENLALKNGEAHNKVLKGDLEIELLKLRIAKLTAENLAKGIGGPEFETNNLDGSGN
jgi:hypothetical protein